MKLPSGVVAWSCGDGTCVRLRSNVPSADQSHGMFSTDLDAGQPHKVFWELDTYG